MAANSPSPQPTSREEELLRENAAQRERIANLEQQVRSLIKLVHGRSSEKLPPFQLNHPQQHLMFPELAELKKKVDAAAAGNPDERPTEKEKQKKRGNQRRSTFPDHLPRVRTVIELPADQRQCTCGCDLVEMPGDVTHELERIEVAFVHEIERKKYICRECQEGVRIAEGPARVIDKGLLGADMLAWLMTERFFNHMPYHRLERKLEAEGIAVARSLMCESVGRCAELLQPIVAQLLEELKEQPAIHSDDTGVTIQQSARGGPKTGYVWVYCDAAGRAVYDFTQSRNRDGPKKRLAGYRGYLQIDACGLYNDLVADGATEAGCMAHARRKFTEAQATDQELAAQALWIFGKLYHLETEAKNLALNGAALVAFRQQHALPVLDELFDWMTVAKTKVLDKSPIGRAIQYAINEEKNLRRYAESAALDLDNNLAERNLRTIAIGRKNWIFVGNEDYGDKAAVLFSLIATCHNIGVDPSLYLRDVLLRISTTSDVTILTPHRWKEMWLAEATADRDARRAMILSSIGSSSAPSLPEAPLPACS